MAFVKLTTDKLTGFLVFQSEQDGALPASAAAVMLKVSEQAVYAASERGRIKFFQWGRNRFYGVASLKDYRWTWARKFADNAQAQAPASLRRMESNKKF
jgi:hypothetical protein